MLVLFRPASKHPRESHAMKHAKAASSPLLRLHFLHLLRGSSLKIPPDGSFEICLPLRQGPLKQVRPNPLHRAAIVCHDCLQLGMVGKVSSSGKSRCSRRSRPDRSFLCRLNHADECARTLDGAHKIVIEYGNPVCLLPCLPGLYKFVKGD